MHEYGIQLDLWQLTIDYMNPVVVLTVESWSTIIVKGVSRWKLKRIWRREYMIMSILLSEKQNFGNDSFCDTSYSDHALRGFGMSIQAIDYCS